MEFGEAIAAVRPRRSRLLLCDKEDGPGYLLGGNAVVGAGELFYGERKFALTVKTREISLILHDRRVAVLRPRWLEMSVACAAHFSAR